MADELTPTDTQQTVELDNGVVLSGMGGDADALRLQFEERAEARGETVEGTVETAAAVEEPPTEAAKVEPAKTPRGPKRYAELTKQREDAERATATEKARADAAEARTRELEAKLNAPPAAVPARAETPPGVATTDAAARPQPREEEVGTKYQTYADFILDTSMWAAEVTAQKTLKQFDTLSQARIEADRASRSRSDLASQAMARGRSVFPDFDAVLNAPDVTKILVPPDHQRAILAVPESEHVMYELAKDPAKLQRFVGLTDLVQVGIEVARLVPRAAVATPASTAPVVRSTTAPPPPQPVGGSTRTTSPSATELAERGGDDYDSSGYREKRRAELAKR